MSYGLLLTGLLFGIGFGYFVQRSGLCFAHGLAEIFVGKGKRIIRIFTVIFIITTLGFIFSKFIDPSLGAKPIGQIRGAGFFNILSGMLFGAGILLNGGCILGTLRQIGEGNLTFLIVLFSFIPGMAFIVYIVDPLLKSHYNVQTLLLTDLTGVSAPYIAIVLAFAAFFWFIKVSKK